MLFLIKLIVLLFSAGECDEFKLLVEGVEEIDFESHLKKMGVEVEWTTPKLDLGVNLSDQKGRINIKSVRQGSCGYKSGLNAGDEIIAINALRVDKKIIDKLDEMYSENDQIDLLIARTGKLQTVTVTLGNGLRSIKELKVNDEELFKKYCKGKTGYSI